VATESASAVPGAPEAVREHYGPPTDAQNGQKLPDLWQLWFPARLGPPRRRKVKGISVRTRRPELPPTQNDRLHHFVKARWVKEWRDAAGWAAVQRRLPTLQRVRISAVIYRRAIGTADASNDLERLKPLVDGLVDAGVVPDDKRLYVEYGAVEERRGDHGILLIVEEVI
jgi:hypothetical protein